MRIVSIVPKADLACIEPTLHLDVELAFIYGQRIPFDILVHVRTEDKRTLGMARPDTFGHGKLVLDARDNLSNSETTLAVQVSLPLSSRQLDHIDELRSTHRKGDVVLECAVEAQFLVSKVVNSALRVGADIGTQGRGETREKQVIYKQQDSRESFQSLVSNMWVLSGDGSRVFLERETLRHLSSVVIRSSDWLHDYAAPWRGERYIVVEIPQISKFSATSNIEQRLNAAIDATIKAADNLSRGEWNDVVEDIRPVWELLRNEADIKGLLERDGYTPEAVSAFNDSVKAQFDLASKFVHRLDKANKRLVPEIRASKEDALLCYAFAMSLLNLVARKTARLR